MADADLSVRFGGDTSALNASIAQARSALASFAPGATSQARGSLVDLSAAIGQARAQSDAATSSWRENLSVLSDLAIVGRAAHDAVVGIFSDVGTINRADFQADADAIRAVGVAAAGANAVMDRAGNAFTDYFTAAAYGQQGARLFTQGQEGLTASIGRSILGIQNYFATAALLRDGAVQAQTAALAAAGSFDRFSEAVNNSGNSFGSTLDTLTHFTSELARIPDMTVAASASIQATIAGMPNYSVGTNDLIIKYLQQVSTNADDAKVKVQALVASFTADGGGVSLADSLLKGIDFTKLDEAKNKVQDLVTLAKTFGQNFANPTQAKAFYDTLISKADQYSTAAMQPLREQLEAFEKLGPLGRVLELGIQGQVDKQVALNTQLAEALRTMQQQAIAAGQTADAMARQSAYEKLISEDSTRVGRANTANENIKTLNDPKASQGRSNSDADVGSDRDLLIRTLIGEAGGEGAAGMEAVANVIKNRVESAFDGMKTYRDVITEDDGKQFNSYRDSDPSGQRARSLGTDSPEYQKAAAIVDKLAAGNLDDNTNGATSFYNPKTAPNAFPMSNTTDIGNQRFGNTAGSPPVRGSDEDDERNERLTQQLDTLKKIDDEKRGGTEADIAQVAIAQQNAAGLHDQVEQAQALLVAKQKDLANTNVTGDQAAIREATKAVADAQEDLAKKTEAARKAQAELNIAQVTPNSSAKLQATLANYDAEIAAATGDAAKIADLEKQKFEASKQYNDQRKADAAATEDANFANAQTKLKETEELIKSQGQSGMLTRAQATADTQASLAKQLDLERAHYAALMQIWGEGTSQYRKAQEDLEKVDETNNALRLKNAIASNNQIYSSYRQEAERIGSTVSSSLMQIIQGTGTFKTLFVNVLKQVTQQFIDMGVKMVADWAARQAAQIVLTTTGQTAQTAAVTAGEAARTSAVAGGTAAQGVATVATMTKSILGSAAETFAGIFGFLSPLMGPAAAGPAAAGEATVAAAASAIPSFDVGAWNLPSNMVAQVHAGEMIVPAGPAAMMRAAAAGGGSGTKGGTDVGSGGDLHTHFHVTALDSRDVRRFFSDNSKHILGAINDGLRSGSHLGLSKLRNPV